MADGIYWSESQRVPCRNSCWPLSGVYVVSGKPNRRYGVGPARRCQACDGKGTIPRPFPTGPLPHPLTHVTFTTHPLSRDGWNKLFTRLETGGESYPDWPGIAFYRPA